MYGKGLVIGEKGSNPLEKQSANLKCWVTSSESGVSLLRTVIEGRTMWAGKAKNAVPHFSAYCIFCSSVYCISLQAIVLKQTPLRQARHTRTFPGFRHFFLRIKTLGTDGGNKNKKTIENNGSGMSDERGLRKPEERDGRREEGHIGSMPT